MTSKELRDKFDNDLQELQDNCPHEKSEWMGYHWAPGHFRGMVRVCDSCDKKLEIRD